MTARGDNSSSYNLRLVCDIPTMNVAKMLEYIFKLRLTLIA
jgi:hypothetical protein